MAAQEHAHVSSLLEPFASDFKPSPASLRRPPPSQRRPAAAKPKPADAEEKTGDTEAKTDAPASPPKSALAPRKPPPPPKEGEGSGTLSDVLNTSMLHWLAKTADGTRCRWAARTAPHRAAPRLAWPGMASRQTPASTSPHRRTSHAFSQASR